MAWWTEQRLHPKSKSKFVVVFGSNFFIPSIKSVGKPKVDFDTKEYKLINHKFNYPGNATWQPIEMKFVDMNGLGDTNDTFDTSAFLWQILNNTGYAYPYLDGASNVSNNPYYNNVQNEQVGANGGHHIATKISFRDDPNTPDVRERSSFRTITTPEKSSTIANSFGKGLDGNIDYKAAHYSRQKISIYQLSPEGADADGNGAKIVECWHLVNPIVKSIGWGDLAYDSEELIEYSLNIVYDWAIYDRKAIGTIFVPDAKPYRDFMKSYALAQSAIDQEQIAQQFEALEDLGQLDQFDLDNNGTISADEVEAAQTAAFLRENLDFIDGAFDADGDGFISEAERLFTENNKEQIEKKLTEAKILDEQAERRSLTLQAEAAAEKIEKIKEERVEQVQKEEAVPKAIYGDGIEVGIFTDVDYEPEYEYEPGLSVLQEPKEQAGSGDIDLTGGLGGGGTVDSFGDVSDGLMDLDTYTGNRTQSENVGIEDLDSNPLSETDNPNEEPDLAIIPAPRDNNSSPENEGLEREGPSERNKPPSVFNTDE